MQGALFPMTMEEKGTQGATWWAGNWECRNHYGYLQQREGGKGYWQFVIYGFGFDDISASVYRIAENGHAYHEDVPIDDKDRLLIRGERYGQDYWYH